jgi:hypothetical protein
MEDQFMSKATPGPWYVHAGTLGGEYTVWAPSEARPITVQTTKANAHLIAAAPELLKIAEAYRNLLRSAAHTEGEVATFHHIESVIAKVRGEWIMNTTLSFPNWNEQRDGVARIYIHEQGFESVAINGPGIDRTGAPRSDFLDIVRRLYPLARLEFLRLKHVHRE